MMNTIWKLLILITRVLVSNLNTIAVVSGLEFINILCSNKYN